jgi:hypothetical protein
MALTEQRVSAISICQSKLASAVRLVLDRSYLQTANLLTMVLVANVNMAGSWGVEGHGHVIPATQIFTVVELLAVAL